MNLTKKKYTHQRGYTNQSSHHKEMLTNIVFEEGYFLYGGIILAVIVAIPIWTHRHIICIKPLGEGPPQNRYSIVEAGVNCSQGSTHFFLKIS